MEKTYDAIVAGGGAVGLTIAGELGQAGHEVLVLEQLAVAEQDPLRQAPLGFRGLNGTSVETLYRRDLLEQVHLPAHLSAWNKGIQGSQLALHRDVGRAKNNNSSAPDDPKKDAAKTGGVFCGQALNAALFEPTRFKYRILGPSFLPTPTTCDVLEKACGDRAESLGVTILRGQKVERITASDDDRVTVQTAKGEKFRGRWLVGADGAHSVVRHLAAFHFAGTEPTMMGYTADCEWEPKDGLKKGFHTTGNGMYINDIPQILHLVHPQSGPTSWDRKLELTQEHFQDVLNIITSSTAVKITKMHSARSWTDRTMQATEYRRGRVLLAGDAAHCHSPLGGQGLNLGLADAVNLGWKLAATIRQEKSLADTSTLDLSLLNTYDSERRTHGEEILALTRIQNAAMQPDALGAALQLFIRHSNKTADYVHMIMARFQGLEYCYDLGDVRDHRLIGGSAPDFALLDGTRFGPKLGQGRALLVDLGHSVELKELLSENGYEDRVEYFPTRVEDARGLQALLIRPDGVVVWVAEEGEKPDIGEAKRQLERWFRY